MVNERGADLARVVADLARPVYPDDLALVIGDGADGVREALERIGWRVQCTSLTFEGAGAGARLVVVGAGLETLADAFRTLAASAAAAPGAALIVHHRNARSARAVIAVAAGSPCAPAVTPEELTRWAAACGLRRTACRDLHEEGAPLLARDAEDAMTRLLVALDPETAVLRLAVRLEPGTARQTPAREQGLLSVVVRTHDPARVELLDHALFALACQEHQPLEVVLVSSSTSDAAVEHQRALLDRHLCLGDLRGRFIHVPSDRDVRGRMANIGVESAQGQYLAFLDDDDVVYPNHYARLVGALRAGAAAWAVARVRLSRFTRDASGALYCTGKSDSPSGAFDLAQLLRENTIPSNAYVLDRARLGRFPVRFSEEMVRHEDYALVLRLATLFRPVWIDGPPSAEYRVRDDGTNSTPGHGQRMLQRVREARLWDESHAILNDLKAHLPVLLSAAVLERELARHYRAGAEGAGLPAHGGSRAAARPDALRYRLADRANDLVKRLPGVHRWIKASLASRTSRHGPIEEEH